MAVKCDIKGCATVAVLKDDNGVYCIDHYHNRPTQPSMKSPRITECYVSGCDLAAVFKKGDNAYCPTHYGELSTPRKRFSKPPVKERVDYESPFNFDMELDTTKKRIPLPVGNKEYYNN